MDVRSRAAKPSTWCGLLLIAIVAVPLSSALGQAVYKYVDEDGNVVYSEQPPPQDQPSERVDVRPGPTSAQQKDAENREQQLQDAASQTTSTGDQRTSKKAEQQLKQKSVKDAEAALERAKQVGPGDRVGTAGGGSRLRESYHERVRAAEEELQRAKKAAR